MNIEWGDADQGDLVGFRGGTWETELLRVLDPQAVSVSQDDDGAAEEGVDTS
jgi:hypothetical protein